MILRKKSLDEKLEDERLKNLSEELEAIALAVLVKELKPGIPYLESSIGLKIKDKFEELDYYRLEDFISLAYKIEPDIESEIRKYREEERERFKEIMAIYAISDYIVKNLIEKGYLTCVKAKDLEEDLKYTNEGQRILEKIEEYVEISELKNKEELICISDVTEETFVEKYKVKPEEYLKNIEEKQKERILKSFKTYDFIKKLKI